MVSLSICMLVALSNEFHEEKSQRLNHEEVRIYFLRLNGGRTEIFWGRKKFHEKKKLL